MDSGSGLVQPAAAYDPSPNTAQPQLQLDSSSSAATASYYASPNLNPNSIPVAGHEAYVPHTAYGNAGTLAYSYAAATAETAAGLAYYYGLGGAVANPQQYGFDPYLSAPAVPGSSNGIGPTPAALTAPQWALQGARPLSRSAMRNHIKKKAKKLVVPAYCEVCKIDCNSADVLVTHKQGKKHKKNLQKLQDSITPKPIMAPVSIPPKAPLIPAQAQQVPEAPIGPSMAIAGQEPSKKKKKKKGALDTPEEFEAKKRRVLEAGAASEAVRVCSICSVVVNDQKVFLYHMAGQKHAAMVKKQQKQEAVAAS